MLKVLNGYDKWQIQNKKYRNCIFNGTQTIFVLVYSGNPDFDYYQQYDTTAGTEKPCLHTEHCLPKNAKVNTDIHCSGNYYRFLD
jgi:hypothetical protein